MFRKNSKFKQLFDSVIKKSKYKARILGIHNRYQFNFDNQRTSYCKTIKQKNIFKPLGNILNNTTTCLVVKCYVKRMCLLFRYIKWQFLINFALSNVFRLN